MGLDGFVVKALPLGSEVASSNLASPQDVENDAEKGVEKGKERHGEKKQKQKRVGGSFTALGLFMQN